MAVYRRPGVRVERKNTPVAQFMDNYIKIGLIAKGDYGLETVSEQIVRDGDSDKDFVSNQLYDILDAKYKGYSYVKDVDYVQSGQYLEWKDTVLNAPFLLKVGSAEDAYKLPAGTYFYAVTAIKIISYENNSVQYGETTISNIESVVLTEDSAVELEWVSVPQADGYRIYRGTTLTNLQLVKELIGEYDYWKDNNTAIPVSITPPTVNNAYKKPPRSVDSTPAIYEGTAVAPATSAANLVTVSDGVLYFNDLYEEYTVRNINLTKMQGANDEETLNNVAKAVTIYVARATGDKSGFVGGDCSFNEDNILNLTEANLGFWGDNVLENGNFSLKDTFWNVGTNWTVNWDEASGNNTTDSLEYDSFVPTNGEIYRLIATVEVDSGSLEVSMGGTTLPTISSNTVIDVEITASNNDKLTFTGTGTGFTGRIKNVKVYKYYETGAIDFTTAGNLDAVANLLQDAIRAKTGKEEFVTYSDGRFWVYSSATGDLSYFEPITPKSGNGVDITKSAYLDFVHGSLVHGGNSDIEVTYSSTDNKFRISSSVKGESSYIVVLDYTGATGTDLQDIGYMNFDGGSMISGENAHVVAYEITYRKNGNNFFKGFEVTDLTVARNLFGDSPIYDYIERLIALPPDGMGAKMVVAVAIPDETPSAYEIALTEMAKHEIDILILRTSQSDVIKKAVSHVLLLSNPDKMMERVGIFTLDVNLDANKAVQFANSIKSDRIALIWDNITAEENISLLVAGRVAASNDRTKSLINIDLPVSSELDKPIYNPATVDYLLANNIMVVDKNQSGKITVIDDLMTSGNDLAGVLSEDYVRKGLRKAFAEMIGKVKLGNSPFDDGIKAIRTAVMKFLDGLVEDEIIAGYEKGSVKVVKSTTDKYKAIVSFSYYRYYTLKRIDFTYYIV